MKKTSSLRQFRALYSFVFVLVISLAIAAFIPLTQFKGEIRTIATDDAKRDLEMLGSLIHEAMLRHDYSTIRESIKLWGEENDRTLTIRAVAPNGFVFAEYLRKTSGAHSHPLRVSKEIRQDGRVLATLHLNQDFALFTHEAEKLVNRNIFSFAVFTVALGIVLWFTLRRTALVPMQKLYEEVQSLNITLEERVRSRTADLGRANEDLESEVGERLKAEEHLKESEERYRTIVANAADGVFLLDLSAPGEPVIAEVNEAACRMHGYTREELVGRPIAALDDVPGKARVKERVKSLQDGKTLTFEVVHVRKDKSTFPLEVSSQMVSVRGKPYIISMERDITERKEAEALLQKAKESLERQNEELRKIDHMKDALLRDVSHELKTPVAKHAMQLEILRPLLEQGQIIPSGRRAFAVMEESIHRQQGVIRNLLNLSRLESGGRQYGREEVNLDKLLRKVLADYTEGIESRGIAVAVDMPEITLLGDTEMLWHVFSNLISNAIKFQGAGVSPEISISAQLEKGHVIVRIEDNGVGMSREVREMVFSRFFQASPSIEGSGVGLTICKRIVEDLGGSIKMESQGVDRGTVAEVRLPLRRMPDRQKHNL